MAYQSQSPSSPSASTPSLTTSAYMVPSPAAAGPDADAAAYSSDEDEVASLPSESTTSSELATLSDDYSDAEEEWRESIEQLELLLSMVIVPFVGKFLGRKCAYWGMVPVLLCSPCYIIFSLLLLTRYIHVICLLYVMD